MFKTLGRFAAILAIASSGTVAVAFAQSNSATSPPPSSPIPSIPVSPPCTPLKQIYAERNWRDAKPIDGRIVCPVSRRANAKKTVQHFYLYRRYRLISPFRYGGGDKWLKWTPIPGAVVGCEGGTWNSHNRSGADGPAQLLGHGQPDVSSGSSPRTKVTYWKYTRDLYESQGLEPWMPSQSCWGGRV